MAAYRRLDGADAGEMTLSWATTDRAQWAGGEREVRLIRDGTCVWRANLARLRGNGRARTISAQADGLWSAMRHRFTMADLHFTAANQHQIAWDLIDHTQDQTDGGLGFTQGTHTGSSVTRSRWVCRYENIAEVVSELGAFSDGFEFDIDPVDKTFDTWTPKRGTASGITLTGSEELTFEWEEDYSDALSYAIATDDDECNPTTAIRSDATAAARFGRREELLIVDSGTLSEIEAAGDEELRIRKTGIVRARCAFDDDYGPAWGTYDLGDTLTVNVSDGPAVFNRDFRIVEIAISLESPSQAYIELGLDGALT